jgi:hypothetical protein
MRRRSAMTTALDHTTEPVNLDKQTPDAEVVWSALAKASFAVVSYVTPEGHPRSSGVVYKLAGRRLFIAVAPEGWKARHIATGSQVAVTVPVRRGGLLSLLAPIPPATISFHGTAIAHAAGSEGADAAIDQLSGLVPRERRAIAAIIEIVPEGAFVTYGIGTSLMQMRAPALARGRVEI